MSVALPASNRGAWPPEGLERVERCPACGGSARHLLHDHVRDRSYLCAPGQWTFFRCEHCRCAYLDPRPDARTAHLAYGNYYAGTALPQPPPAGRLRAVRTAIRNGYLNARYGYQATPAWKAGARLARLAPRRREQTDESIRCLPFPGPGARLLDIGCGEGEFLRTMQDLGWVAHGLEPSPEAAAAARARGISVDVGTLEDAHLDPSSFDAITFRLVLEHLANPAAALEVCRLALRPGGTVAIVSPNLESEGHRTFGDAWIYLDTPRQPVVHTPASLTRLLDRAGFEVIEHRASRTAAWSFRMSHAIARGMPPFRNPPRLPPTLAVRARLADVRALRRPELAEQMIVLARKN